MGRLKMSLKKYSYEELKDELYRRDKIRNDSWPKKIVIPFEPMDYNRMDEFLTEYCGFHDGSDEYYNAMKVTEQVDVTIEIFRDGSIVMSINSKTTSED